MAALAASLLAMILAGLAAMHVAWAAGAGRVEGFVPSDRGRPLFTPGPLATLTVAAGLATAALVVVCRAGVVCLGLPPAVASAGAVPEPAACCLAAIALAAATFARRSRNN